MMTASAARTAASLTNSVREEPRKSAARSMIAMSCSGKRIDKGVFILFRRASLVDLQLICG
jgi:hypothetical protein